MNPNDPDPIKAQPPKTGNPPKAKPIQPKPVAGGGGKNPPTPTPIPVSPTPAKPVPVAPKVVKPIPVAPKPVAPTPVPAQPVKPVPVAPKPVVAQPVKPSPVAPKPVAPKPVAPTPVAPTPVAPKPVAPKPVAAAPAKPIPAKPVAAKPIAAKRKTAAPVPVGGAARPIPVAAPSADDELAMVGEGPEDRDEAEDDAEVDVKRLKKQSPPWLISTIVHTLVIILAGIWFWPSEKKEVVEFEATFAEVEGEQLEDTVDLIAEDDIAIEDDSFSEEVILDPVDDPLSAPMDMIADLNPVGVSSSFVAPTVGAALDGRTPGMKAGLLKAYGGTKSTEKAVASGLGWLKKNMDKKSGAWSLVGPYEDGGTQENDVAATAMAVLAFQGAGHTTMEGNFKPELNRAWRFLLSRQQPEGNFQLGDGAPHNHAFYTHGQVSIALCELYALTRDERLREPAQKAINYIIKTQADDGGWRYQPNTVGDLSVTGWIVMALQSARMAGLEVDSPCLERISGFLDTVSVEEKSKYRYMPKDVPTPTMTAEGLLCRQYLGWHHDEPALLAGTKYISENPIQWREPDHYYWYYATQVMHHMEGQEWQDWNAVMRVEIPKHQVASGKEAGSWYDVNDRWSSYGGRLYTTCLSLYMLEVYYRHLPLYNSVYSK